jgi:hypothetical protein
MQLPFKPRKSRTARAMTVAAHMLRMVRRRLP